MTVEKIINALGGEVLVEGNTQRDITGAIAGDLLSFIIGAAKEGSAWITIQAHLNVAAVAVLKDISLIIIAASRTVPQDLLDRCKMEKITVLKHTESIYALCARLYALGIKG